jgi:MerR family transcriptional regulator, copper efflux regulator
MVAITQNRRQHAALEPVAVMNIGALAQRTGVAAKTIRYYESIGLLDRPVRSNGNYRVYGERDLATLRFVQRARGLGFAIKEVANLLTLWRDRRRSSADVRALAAAHLAEIEGKLEEMRAIRATLRHLVECCHGDDRPDCPIIDDLETATRDIPAQRPAAKRTASSAARKSARDLSRIS